MNKLFTLKSLRACSRSAESKRASRCSRLIATLLAVLTCATAVGAQTTVSTDSELRTAIQTDGANITVTADIDLSNSTLSIASGKTVTINLGGHTLDRKLTKRGEGGGQVITVRSGATLNLSNGTLKGGWGGAGGALVNEGGTVTLTKIESADAAEMMAYALQRAGDFRRIRPDTYWAWWGAFRSMYCPDELPATNKFTINKGAFGGFGGQTCNVTFEGDADIQDGTGIESINNSRFIIHNSASAVYDLSGRKLNSQFIIHNSKLPMGIYINNGRKVLY